MVDNVLATQGATEDVRETCAGNKGVDRISELPLDVLCEIFRYLHPTAILRLAQTCKVFRRYLMNKNLARASVWVPALEAVEDLPPPPEGVSEPSYTYFVFYVRCEICRSIEVNKLRPICIVTQCFCEDCLPKAFKDLKDIEGASDLPWDEDDVMSMVPFLTDAKCLGTRYGFHVQTVDRLIRDFKSIDPKDYEAIDDLAGRWRFWFNSRMEFQDEYLNYEQSLDLKCDYERSRRQQQLEERLADMGWEKECESFFHGESHSHSRKTKREQFLNSKCFGTNVVNHLDWRPDWKKIDAEIIPIMESERLYPLWKEHKDMMAKRIQKWFKPAFLAYVFSQPPNTVAVSAKELALMPEWRDALLSRPLEEDLTADLISKAVQQIPVSCERIKQWKTEQLLSLVRKSKTYEGQEVTEDVLCLASTVFRCGICGETYTHPIGLVHPCNYVTRTSLLPEVFEEVISHVTTEDSISSTPLPPTVTRRPPQEQEKLITKAFKPERLRSHCWGDLEETTFDDPAHNHMVNLLDALGYDRRTLATVMQNKQVDVEVFCPCYESLRMFNSDTATTTGRWAMSWFDAIKYSKAHATKQADATAQKWYAKLEERDREVVATLAKERQMRHCRPYFWDPRRSVVTAWNLKNTDTRVRYLKNLEVDAIEHPEGTAALKAYVDAVGYYNGSVNRLRTMFRFEDPKPEVAEVTSTSTD